MVSVPVDLHNLSDEVKNDVVKKDSHDVKIKNIEDRKPVITNLATNAFLSTKINEVKREILNIITLATVTALTAVENKIHNISNLVKRNWL